MYLVIVPCIYVLCDYYCNTFSGTFITCSQLQRAQSLHSKIMILTHLNVSVPTAETCKMKK